jgi:hypothetical protein
VNRFFLSALPRYSNPAIFTPPLHLLSLALTFPKEVSTFKRVGVRQAKDFGVGASCNKPIAIEDGIPLGFLSGEEVP